MIYSTTELMDTELKYFKVFVEKNNYPNWVIREIFIQVKINNDSNSSPLSIETVEVPTNENETVTKNHMLLLPYQGDKGISFTKLLKRNLDKHLSNNVKMQITFTGQKLSTQFHVKERTKFEHKHDVIYFGKFPEKNCTDSYVRESATRISEQIIDHGGGDKKSHLFRYAVVNEHRNASYDDFKIIGSGSRNKTFKRKVAEALLIKEL